MGYIYFKGRMKMQMPFLKQNWNWMERKAKSELSSSIISGYGLVKCLDHKCTAHKLLDNVVHQTSLHPPHFLFCSLRDITHIPNRHLSGGFVHKGGRFKSACAIMCYLLTQSTSFQLPAPFHLK